MRTYQKGEIVAVAVYTTDPYGRQVTDWKPAVYSRNAYDGGHWVFDLPTSFNTMDGRWPECIAYDDIKPAALFWPWLENGFVTYPYAANVDANDRVADNEIS